MTTTAAPTIARIKKMVAAGEINAAEAKVLTNNFYRARQAKETQAAGFRAFEAPKTGANPVQEMKSAILAINGYHYETPKHISSILVAIELLSDASKYSTQIATAPDAKVASIVSNVQKYRKASEAQAYCLAAYAVVNGITEDGATYTESVMVDSDEDNENPF